MLPTQMLPYHTMGSRAEVRAAPSRASEEPAALSAQQ